MSTTGQRVVIDTNVFITILSKADDNKFVDCYLVANAQYLISNDAHFSELRQLNFPKITIVTTKEFKKIFS